MSGLETKLGAPLDSRQVERISAVHGGFLYQHLYGVACLLTVGREPGSLVMVERDEDIEVVVGKERHYVQVKVRNRPLQPADIDDALSRVAEIRQEHASGNRSGTARFNVVTNAQLGPVLQSRVAANDLPPDVKIDFPGAAVGRLPPSSDSIDSLFAWCAEQAKAIPFGTLSAETLVWKLAAQVLHAATGKRDRVFHAEQMPAVLEQLLVQLQDFPDPPQDYRPQINEPALITESRIRVLIGFSGAGKTAWASQAALHCPDPIAYFDVRDMAAAAVPSNLARELAARFVGGRNDAFGGTLLAERTGLDALRLCARRLVERGSNVHVILDNAHLLPASTVRALADAAPSLHFLCLAQPWSDATLLESTFGISSEALGGWTIDDIAGEFAAAGAAASVETVLRILKVTAGLPLFVKNAALVAARDYRGDAAAFCDALEARTNDQATAQEIILAETFEHLAPNARQIAALLSLSEIPLTRPEVAELVGSVTNEQDLAAGLRHLRRASFVVGFQGDRLGLHDATRPLAVDARKHLSPKHVHSALECLVRILVASLSKERDIGRLSFVLRLMPRVGMTDVLVDLAAHEMFYEQGDPRTLRIELEKVATDEALDASDRFWANDALAYWESRDGGTPDASRLSTMAKLVEEGSLGEAERMNLSFKELAYWGNEGKRHEVERVYAAAAKIGDATSKRLLKYNYAVALFRLRSFADVRDAVDSLVDEYFALIGINERDVVGKSNLQLRAIIPKSVDYDHIKRLADCLQLWSGAVVELGFAPIVPNVPPLARRIFALKFYNIATAARSVVTTGLEAVDDFIGMRDPVGARDVLEQFVLPVVRDSHITDMLLPARSHYAIILAWNREFAAARHELETLRQYAMDPAQVAMLDERERAVDGIISGRLELPTHPLRRISSTGKYRLTSVTRKVGRNEKCPCGSGLKFKRCCGKT